jgi:hypothetical protein
MALATDPTTTYSSQGNILAASTSIGAGNYSNSNICDFSTNSIGGWISVIAAGGATVNSTNGCQISIFPAGDGTTHYDTIAASGATLAMTANTNAQMSFVMPNGKYSVQLKNLDPANAITAAITASTTA